MKMQPESFISSGSSASAAITRPGYSAATHRGISHGLLLQLRHARQVLLRAFGEREGLRFAILTMQPNQPTREHTTVKYPAQLVFCELRHTRCVVVRGCCLQESA